MSRTFRSIEHFWQYKFLTLWGHEYTKKEIEQHRQFNGYDGCNRSRSYDSLTGWREEYVGASKRFYKKRYHKQRRRNWDKLHIREGLEE